MAATLNPDDLVALVDALADGQWHSGEDLAAASKITRAGLAKRIAKLGQWGLVAEAQAGRGYRLTHPVERLDPATIRRGLPSMTRDRLAKIEVLPVTDSTNQRLLESDNADDPRALFAEHQSAGRGRLGRTWISPFGANVYLSLAWTFPHWPAQLTVLPIAVGIACARALGAQGVDTVRLKWPNDLVVAGRKLGGILIEQRGEAGGNCRAIIGVGLNVAMQADAATQIAQPWTSVEQVLGRTASRNALAAELVAQLVLAIDQFSAQGFVAFAAEWDRLDVTRNQRVRIEAGQQSYEGIARGLDETGALKVETSEGIKRALAGEVSLRPA